MLKRKIVEQLLKWKNKSEKKALIIEGARQVGKTYIIRSFAKENYQNVIEINFIENKSYKDIFSADLSFDKLLERIKLFFPITNKDEKTLLFLDEIQDCPEAITALKSFYEQDVFDVIASGSLLGVHYNRVNSFPVGYVERETLYPLDFEEFMMALGQDDLYRLIESSYNDKTKLESIFHNRALELFVNYIVVGGMPEVVKTFVETKDFNKVLNIQRNIINDYKDDIAKYANTSQKVKAREVFDSIPFQLSKTNKKFQYSVVKKGGRSSDYHESIQWLIDAGIIYKTKLLTNLEIPLSVYSNPDHFKIYLMDTGLLISQMGQEAQRLLIMNDLGIAKGAIYENIIAVILKQSGHNLYYYERNSGLELDFIIEKDTKVVAVEVKSGENTRSKSLQTILENKSIDYGIRLSRKYYSDDNNIKSYPLYLSIFI